MTEHGTQHPQSIGSSKEDVIYAIVCSIVFSLVSFTFLFPCNYLIPLDRRTVAVVGACVCYLISRYLFPANELNLITAVDFDVLVLLSSIMIINHIVVHLKETRKVLDYFQCIVQNNPAQGFWMISIAAFLISPFLTNDGVCLLLVEPILNAFAGLAHDDNDNQSVISRSDHHQRAEFVYDPELAEKDSNDDKMKMDNSESKSNDRINHSRNNSLTNINKSNKTNNNSEGIQLTELPTPSKSDQRNENVSPTLNKLRRGDALYFLLTLACSTNIGSALTYTGNPQNMLVSSDSLSVMSSFKFTVYMSLPALVTWYLTTKWIEVCWFTARKQFDEENHIEDTAENSVKYNSIQYNSIKSEVAVASIQNIQRNNQSTKSPLLSLDLSLCQCDDEKSTRTATTTAGVQSPSMKTTTSPLSPRRRRQRARQQLLRKVVRTIASPAPYVILSLLALMVVLIFVDIMPIAGLVCVMAILMTVVIVFGNHWRDHEIWIEKEITNNTIENHNNTAVMTTSTDNNQQLMHMKSHRRMQSNASDLSSASSSKSKNFKHQYRQLSAQKNALVTAQRENNEDEEDLGPRTYEDKLDNLNEFFEELFKSIDYSLLLIFIGTFIVIESMASTGIPAVIWKAMVGAKPFKTVSSILSISLFVIVASQLLGNVAVVQLAKPNVEPLEAATKRFAWSLIAFVSTIGGNLTITGSAANIIVAEKANRIDPTIAMDFFKHFRVCFLVTLLSCVLGSVILTVIITIDNSTGSQW